MSVVTRVHRPLKIVAFNINGIGKQRFELGKQQKDRRIDMALLSETRLKLHERFFIPNYHVYRTSLSGVKRRNCRLCQERYPT
jgi:hypothetical protein